MHPEQLFCVIHQVIRCGYHAEESAITFTFGQIPLGKV